VKETYYDQMTKPTEPISLFCKNLEAHCFHPFLDCFVGESVRR